MRIQYEFLHLIVLINWLFEDSIQISSSYCSDWLTLWGFNTNFYIVLFWLIDSLRIQYKYLHLIVLIDWPFEDSIRISSSYCSDLLTLWGFNTNLFILLFWLIDPLRIQYESLHLIVLIDWLFEDSIRISSFYCSDWLTLWGFNTNLYILFFWLIDSLRIQYESLHHIVLIDWPFEDSIRISTS